MQRPHKSTTHEEQYYHIDNKGTVFFRKEEDGWYYNLSLCHYKDQFCRATGRSIARRKYFQNKIRTHAEPSYDVAEGLFYDVYCEYN